MITLKPHAGYQVTDSVCIGSIPSHWAFHRLGQHFIERRETVSDKDYQPLSVTKSGVVPQLETAAKTDNGDNRKRVIAGDFVINSRSDRKGSAGISDLDGSVSVISTVITPIELDRKFVHHLLRSQPFQEEYYRFGSGIVADLWSTRYSSMKNIKLPIPPADEQRAIASFLDHETAQLDAFIADQEELIELLNERRVATITQSVTKGLDPHVPMKDSGVEWIGEVPEGWTVKPLKHLTKFTAGGTPDSNNAAFWSDLNGAPWISISDMSSRDTVSKSAKLVTDAGILDKNLRVMEAGTVLFAMYASVGEVSILTVPAVSNQAILGLTPRRDKGESKFIFYALKAINKWLPSLYRSNTQNNLNAEQVGNLRIPTPSLTEQQQIVDHLDHETTEIDAAIADAKGAIELSKERRAAVISAAVTGKIDVRNHVTAELGAA